MFPFVLFHPHLSLLWLSCTDLWMDDCHVVFLSCRSLFCLVWVRVNHPNSSVLLFVLLCLCCHCCCWLWCCLVFCFDICCVVCCVALWVCCVVLRSLVWSCPVLCVFVWAPASVCVCDVISTSTSLCVTQPHISLQDFAFLFRRRAFRSPFSVVVCLWRWPRRRARSGR